MFLSFFRISFLKKCTDMLRGQQSFIQFNFTSTVFVIWKPQQVFKMKNALTNKQTNKQTNKKDWHFHSFSTIHGHSSRCSLADFYISKFIRTALTLPVAAFETYESQVIVRGYKRANGIKWANRVTTTRLCQTQCRNTRSVFIGLLSFLEVFLLPFCKFLLKN